MVSLILAYYQTRADTRSLHHQLERNAVVLADSVGKSAEPLVESNSYSELQHLVDRFKDSEQIAGIAVYSAGGQLVAISSGLGARLDRVPLPIVQSLGDGLTHAAFLPLGGDPMHVIAIPLRHDPYVIGILSIFHDTAYIDAQVAALWRRALIGVGIQTLLIGCITLLTIRWGFGRPLARMTQWLHELRTGAVTAGQRISVHGEFEPLSEEVTRLASSLVAARAAAEEEARLRETAESNWTAERLRVFVQSRLGGDRLFAVSNREPYEHVRGAEGIECVVPASGLVTALEPVLRACDGTWIAQATGNADHEMVDAMGRVRVPPDHPQYTLRRVWLTPGRGTGVLFRLRQRRPLAAVPHRAYAANLPHRGLGSVSSREPKSSPTRCWRKSRGRKSSSAGAGLSLCAAAADDQGTPAGCAGCHLLAYPMAQLRSFRQFARGGANCWMGCWARI